MPPVLWRWPTTSKGDAGGTDIGAEPPHQYPITFGCCVTDGSQGAVWQNGAWSGSVHEAKVFLHFSMWKKMEPSDIHWHLLGVHRDQPVGVSMLWQQVMCFSSGDNDSGSPLWVKTNSLSPLAMCSTCFFREPALYWFQCLRVAARRMPKPSGSEHRDSDCSVLLWVPWRGLHSITGIAAIVISLYCCSQAWGLFDNELLINFKWQAKNSWMILGKLISLTLK